MSHALSFLGVISPGMASLADPKASNLPYTKTLLPGGIAGVAGALYGLKVGHPFLGFIAAESIGQNTYRFYRNQGDDRKIAMCNVGQAAAIVAGSLLYKTHPFWGGLAGLLAAMAVVSQIKGSNANMFVAGLRK